MTLWYHKENHEENFVDNIDIRCSYCGKPTILSVKIPIYKDIINKFVLNEVLHHVGMSLIFGMNQQL